MTNGLENLNSLEAAILRVLEGRQGRDCAISREQLLLEINSDSPLFPVAERTMRETIKHLVKSHGVSIGSCHQGYFMIETAEELEQVCAYYHSYGMSSLHSEARLRKMSLAELLGQLTLKFTQTGVSNEEEKHGDII